MYQHKTPQEKELQTLVDSAHLNDQDFRNLYWQLWGGCSTNPTAWRIFENLTRSYISTLLRIRKKEDNV